MIEETGSSPKKKVTQRLDLKSDFRKNLIYFGGLKRKEIRLFKKLLKQGEIDTCYLKTTKRTKRPILYIDHKKIGPLAKSIPKILEKYKASAAIT